MHVTSPVNNRLHFAAAAVVFGLTAAAVAAGRAAMLGQGDLSAAALAAITLAASVGYAAVAKAAQAVLV